ncbi:uncharacterized protein LOC127241333 isoform X2 [Andrographis paniculata]|uniref:uncharacterized protein LOC127241333 isoform X2 n=1 Tax=Andrographis paniculata TaxID=175694 RepID=UPI0021E89C23|nr:uncharacterized protein LOC127241333 isoform X2 [Andrographis paniculata]
MEDSAAGEDEITEIVEYREEVGESEKVSRLSRMLSAGMRLGKKVAIVGIVVSSAPVLLPPLAVISALGFAFSVPYGFVFVSYVGTENLMRKLLPPPEIKYITYEEEGGEGVAGLAMEDDGEGMEIELVEEELNSGEVKEEEMRLLEQVSYGDETQYSGGGAAAAAGTEEEAIVSEVCTTKTDDYDVVVVLESQENEDSAPSIFEVRVDEESSETEDEKNAMEEGVGYTIDDDNIIDEDDEGAKALPGDVEGQFDETFVENVGEKDDDDGSVIVVPGATAFPGDVEGRFDEAFIENVGEKNDDGSVIVVPGSKEPTAYPGDVVEDRFDEAFIENVGEKNDDGDVIFVPGSKEPTPFPGDVVEDRFDEAFAENVGEKNDDGNVIVVPGSKGATAFPGDVEGRFDEAFVEDVGEKNDDGNVIVVPGLKGATALPGDVEGRFDEAFVEDVGEKNDDGDAIFVPGLRYSEDDEDDDRQGNVEGRDDEPLMENVEGIESKVDFAMETDSSGNMMFVGVLESRDDEDKDSLLGNIEGRVVEPLAENEGEKNGINEEIVFESNVVVGVQESSNNKGRFDEDSTSGNVERRFDEPLVTNEVEKNSIEGGLIASGVDADTKTDDHKKHEELSEEKMVSFEAVQETTTYKTGNLASENEQADEILMNNNIERIIDRRENADNAAQENIVDGLLKKEQRPVGQSDKDGAIFEDETTLVLPSGTAENMPIDDKAAGESGKEDNGGEYLVEIAMTVAEPKREEVDAPAVDSGLRSNEAAPSEKDIWKKIDAIRAIVGFERPNEASYFEELKALYLFTGIEPPSSIVDSSDDLSEFNKNLSFLMSVIGVK